MNCTSLLESVSPAIAAATLQEMPMNLRVQLAESLADDHLASIITEMQMDETVDLLDELLAEKREAVFVLLTRERVDEIHDLSRMSASGVGSIMNTNFITVKETQTVREVMKIVKEETEARGAFLLCLCHRRRGAAQGACDAAAAALNKGNSSYHIDHAW